MDARAKTCCDTCRSARSRRLRAANDPDRDLGSEHFREIAQYARNEEPDLVRDVVREEIRPIVREALTEEVLRGINDLLGLTPLAIAALKDDLENEDDPGLRQRAAALVTKYTMGHPALIQPKDAEPNAQMVVHFALPRPDGEAVTIVDSEGEEILTKTCDECSVEKEADQFVASSNRCNDCYEKRRADVLARFPDGV